ncbi:MAG: hypothetical protein V2A79_14950 [Planctomycetota bacterium]
MTPTNDGFTEGERAIIEKVAWEVGDKIIDRLDKHIDDRIVLHHSTCSNRVGKKLLAIVAGIAAGVGAAGALIERALDAAK